MGLQSHLEVDVNEMGDVLVQFSSPVINHDIPRMTITCEPPANLCGSIWTVCIRGPLSMKQRRHAVRAQDNRHIAAPPPRTGHDNMRASLSGQVVQISDSCSADRPPSSRNSNVQNSIH